MTLSDLDKLPKDVQLVFRKTGEPTNFTAVTIDKAMLVENNGEQLILLDTNFIKPNIINNN